MLKRALTHKEPQQPEAKFKFSGPGRDPEEVSCGLRFDGQLQSAKTVSVRLALEEWWADACTVGRLCSTSNMVPPDSGKNGVTGTGFILLPKTTRNK